MLARGASPYDVAKLLGDTVETVEEHYASFVKELRERARRIMENGEGIENPIAPILHNRKIRRAGFNDSKRFSGG